MLHFFAYRKVCGRARTSSLHIFVLFGALTGLALTGGCKPKGPVETAAVVPTAQTSPAAEEGPVASVKAPSGQEKKVVSPLAKAARHAEKQEDAAAGRATSIAGGWVNAGGACDSGASVFFNADGTYMSEGEQGTWALTGKTLTVTTSTILEETEVPVQGPDESTGDTGEKTILTLLSLTDDTARVVLANGSNANWTRCTS
jgi:hypothetical protein